MKLYDYDVEDTDKEKLTPEEISDLILQVHEYEPKPFWK
jgi:hypothetical protein